MAVVTALADSPYLTNPGEFRHGKLVFFDFVGLFMVVYSAQVGNIMNFAMAFVILLRIVSKITGRRSVKGV